MKVVKFWIVRGSPAVCLHYWQQLGGAGALSRTTLQGSAAFWRCFLDVLFSTIAVVVVVSLTSYRCPYEERVRLIMWMTARVPYNDKRTHDGDMIRATSIRPYVSQAVTCTALETDVWLVYTLRTKRLLFQLMSPSVPVLFAEPIPTIVIANIIDDDGISMGTRAATMLAWFWTMRLGVGLVSQLTTVSRLRGRCCAETSSSSITTTSAWRFVSRRTARKVTNTTRVASSTLVGQETRGTSVQWSSFWTTGLT